MKSDVIRQYSKYVSKAFDLIIDLLIIILATLSFLIMVIITSPFFFPVTLYRWFKNDKSIIKTWIEVFNESDVYE